MVASPKIRKASSIILEMLIKKSLLETTKKGLYQKNKLD